VNDTCRMQRVKSLANLDNTSQNGRLQSSSIISSWLLLLTKLNELA
jgi:hypothetical protein